MSQGKIFKLMVQVSDNCIELLKYFDKNITVINNMGVKIQVDKISGDESNEETIEILRKKGVTRLPVLILPDGKLLVGLKRIMDLFEKNLNNVRMNDRLNPSGEFGPEMSAEMGANPDMTDFWMRELYSGKDRKGNLVPRNDPDEGDNEGDVDFQEKMAQYRRKEPAHRRSDSMQADIDLPPRTNRRRKKRPSRWEEEDNIAESDSDSDDGYMDDSPKRTDQRKHVISRGEDSSGDSMDQRMLDAWLNNNPE